MSFQSGDWFDYWSALQEAEMAPEKVTAFDRRQIKAMSQLLPPHLPMILGQATRGSTQQLRLAVLTALRILGLKLSDPPQARGMLTRLGTNPSILSDVYCQA